MKKKLTKSRTDRVIFGVAGGFAKYFNIDTTIVRLIFSILAIAGSTGIILYVIAALIMPPEESESEDYEYAHREQDGYSAHSEEMN